MVSPGHVAAPPMFFRLAAHPLRWRLLTELADSDYRVRELVNRVDQPQNLVSYHLRLLREEGLVTATRSTFDGRDSYYHLDLDRCADELAAGGSELHPSLGRVAEPPTGPARPRRIAVLFVCTGNTVRSPIAEALLRQRAADHVEVASAGIRPGRRVHPDAVRVLRETFGIDIAGRRPQHLDALAGRTFHRVITLCDRAREACPQFPDRSRRAHWSVPEPDTGHDGGHGDRSAFHRTAADIDNRVRHLLPVLAGTDDQGDQP